MRKVQAVVVFWNRFPACLVEEARVLYVEAARAAEWLRRQRPTTTADLVPLVADAIIEARPHARADAVGGGSSRVKRSATTAVEPRCTRDPPLGMMTVGSRGIDSASHLE